MGGRGSNPGCTGDAPHSATEPSTLMERHLFQACVLADRALKDRAEIVGGWEEVHNETTVTLKTKN